MTNRLVITWLIVTILTLLSIIGIIYTDVSYESSCRELDKAELHYDVDDGWLVLIDKSDEVIGVYDKITPRAHFKLNSTVTSRVTKLGELSLEHSEDFYAWCFNHDVLKSTPVVIKQ